MSLSGRIRYLSSPSAQTMYHETECRNRYEKLCVLSQRAIKEIRKNVKEPTFLEKCCFGKIKLFFIFMLSVLNKIDFLLLF